MVNVPTTLVALDFSDLKVCYQRIGGMCMYGVEIHKGLMKNTV